MQIASTPFRRATTFACAIFVQSVLFLLTPSAQLHSQCLDGSRVITSVSIEITADDLTDACYPLTIRIGKQTEIFAIPSSATMEFECPPCELAYSITSGNLASCRASGNFDTADDDEVSVILKEGGSSTEVTFELSIDSETIDLPNPVSQIMPSDSLEFCAGNTVQFVGVNNDGFNSETFFRWSYSYDNIKFNSVGEGSDTLSFFLPEDVMTSETLYLQANTYSDFVCNVRAYGAEDPENLSIKFYPQPPDIISAIGIAPSCPDGDGSIRVVHNQNFDPGTTFVYTLTQYVASPDGDCDSVNLPGTSIGCDDFQGSTFVTNYCGAGQGSNFCSGFIETFSVAISSYSDSARTIVIDPNRLNAGGNNVRMRAGVYSLEIEAMTEPGYIVCVKRFYVEIPETEYTPVQISQPEVDDVPLCIGGNEGSLHFELVGGLEPYHWRFFSIGQVEALDSALNQQTFTTQRLLRFSEDNLYRVEVRDGCTNDSTFLSEELEVRLSVDGESDLSILTNELASDLAIDCYVNGIGDGVWAVDVDNNVLPAEVTYQFRLFNGNDTLSINLDTLVESNIMGHTFLDLGLGVYTVLVNSSNGCSGVAQTNFTLPDDIAGAFSFFQPCPGQANGRIDFTRTSGSDSISFFLNDGPVSAEKNGDVFTIYNIPQGELVAVAADLCLESNPVSLVSTVNSGVYDLLPLPELFFEDDTTLTNLVHGDTVRLACVGDFFFGGRITYVANAGDPEVLVTKDKDEYSEWLLDSRTIILEDLGAGSYTVEVQDTCQMSLSMTFVVEVPDSINAIFTTHDLTCAGRASGEIEVSISGGTIGSFAGGLAYNVQLFNNDSNEQITNSEACGPGSEYCIAFQELSEDIPFRVEVSDGNGCLRVFDSPGDLLTLDSPEPLVLESVELGNLQHTVIYLGLPYVQCKGDSNVVGTFSAQGGTLPYQYYLTKTNNNQWPLPYDSSSLGSFDSLSFGEYSLSVRDNFGCFADTFHTFTIYESHQSLSATLEALQYAHGANTSCYDSVDASLTALATGGIVPYTYILTNLENAIPIESSDGNFDFLSALTAEEDPLTYQIDVHDSLGCYVQTEELLRQITLSSPEPVSVEINVLSDALNGYDILCFADSALISISSSGGHFPDHSFALKKVDSLQVVESGLINAEGQTVEFLLGEGTFKIELKDSLGCVAQPQLLSLVQPASKVAIHLDTVMFPKCIDGYGEIHVHGFGGVAADVGNEYQFRIRNVGTLEYDSTVLSGDSVVFLKQANVYEPRQFEIEIRDGNGCVAFDTVTMISNPQPLALTLFQATPPSCYGASNGSIEVVAENVDFTDDSTYYIYLQGGHLPSDSTMVVETNELSYVLSSLEATDIHGNFPFKIWLEDKNLCSYPAGQYLYNIDLPSYDTLLINLMPASRLQESCALEQDGSLHVNISGGVKPYACSFDGLNFFTVAESDSILRYGLASGVYNFFIRDSLFVESQPGCEKYASYSIAEGRQVKLAAEIANVSCKGGEDGAIDLIVSVENLIYPEAVQVDSLFINWTQEKFAGSQFNTNEDLTDIKSGVYNVKVSYKINSKLCQDEARYTVFEPTKLFSISDINVYDAKCGNLGSGQVIVNVEGGWPSMRNYYSIEGGAWNVFDGKKIFLRGIETGETKIKVRQGTSTCTDSVFFEIIEKSLEISLDSIVPPSCPGIDDAAIILSSNLKDIVFSVAPGLSQEHPVFSGLGAGSYSITAAHKTDTLCVSQPLDVVVSDPPECIESELQAFISSVNPVACESQQDGQAFIVAHGGLLPYKYWWNGVEGTNQNLQLTQGTHSVIIEDSSGASIELTVEIDTKTSYSVEAIISKASCSNTCDGSISLSLGELQSNYDIVWENGDSTFNIEDLCIGEYSCVITDRKNANCIKTQQFAITTYAPLTIEATKNKKPTCFDGADGELAVAISGGSGMYSCLWSNGGTQSRNNGLKAGTYTLTVDDNVLGCQASANFFIDETAQIKVPAKIITPPACFGSSDGRIQLRTENTINPLFTWNNGAIGSQIKGVKSGIYSYTIINSNGCTFSDTVLVKEPMTLVVDVGVNDASCFGACDGKVSAEVSGGTMPYSVTWSNGSKSSVQANLCSGTYNLLVVDKNKCSISSTAMITSPSKVNVTLSAVMPRCYESSDGQVISSVTGGTGSYKYLWNTKDTTAALTNLRKGKYSLLVRDQSQCGSAASVTLTQPTPLRVDLNSVFPPACFASSDGRIEVLANGSNGGYEYRWNNNVIESAIENLTAGVYSVVCRDAKNCEVSKTITLVDPPVLLINKLKVIHPKCVNSATGELSFQVVGGTAPYNAQWSNGSIGFNLANLDEGAYDALIVDKNGCEIKKQFVLVDPEPLLIHGLPEKAIICEGGNLKLQPDGVWSEYEWVGPNSFYSNARSVICNVPGVYTLKVNDSQSCVATAATSLSVSSKALVADFLRISEAVALKSIIFIDITSPIPQQTEWLVPVDDGIVSAKKNNGLLEVTFAKPGDYLIGLKSTLGDCESIESKIITIVDGRDSDGGRESNNEFETEIYPNPIDGELVVEIHTSESQSGRLRLISSSDHEVFRDLSFKGSQRIVWDTSQLIAGVYFLIIESDAGNSVERIVVFH